MLTCIATGSLHRAFIAAMLDMVGVVVGQEYWLHLDDAHKNNAYTTTDHRHHFRPGAVKSVEAGGFWVQPALKGVEKRRQSVLRSPLGTTPATPNQVTPFVPSPLSYAPVWIHTTASHADAESLMAFGQNNLRCVEWTSISLALFTTSPRNLDAEARMQREEEIHALSRPLKDGETKIDFFV